MPTSSRTIQENLRASSESLKGATVERVFCKGKYIFMAFSTDRFLHNHLLMRGRWRTIKGRMLLLPTEMWLALETHNITVVNINGQILRPLDPGATSEAVGFAGARRRSAECSREHIIAAICQQEACLGEALLDQSVLSGIGNVAKSEGLFLAQVHPEATAAQLGSNRTVKLAECICYVMWQSYQAGGRWTHRVYRRAGMKCYECGGRIAMIRQGKQRRSTYLCPTCQIA